jgi:hypothetical protein
MPAVDARVRAWSASAAARGVLPQHAAMMAIRAVLEASAADMSSLRSGRTRIERLAGAQMDLALARAHGRAPHDGRLASRALERAAPWAALAPLHDARAVRLGLAAQLEDAGTPRGMAQRRYGWGGIAPQTLEAIARDSGRPMWVVAAAIGRAVVARGRA